MNDQAEDEADPDDAERTGVRSSAMIAAAGEHQRESGKAFGGGPAGQ